MINDGKTNYNKTSSRKICVAYYKQSYQLDKKFDLKKITISLKTHIFVSKTPKSTPKIMTLCNRDT